jgi:hypothetical protein
MTVGSLSQISTKMSNRKILCALRLWLAFFLTSTPSINAHTETKPQVRLQKAREMVPELFKYMDSGGRVMRLSRDFWLTQWLEKVLEGGLTGFSVEFFMAPTNAPYYHFGACSVAPNPGSGSPGQIWVKSNSSSSSEGQGVSNQMFFDSWFAFFCEISNLMSAGEFKIIDDQAAEGSITEDQYCLAVIRAETKAQFRGILLFDSIIGPLRRSVSPSLTDERSQWEGSPLLSAETHNEALSSIDEGDAQNAGHFRYYREAYRNMPKFARFSSALPHSEGELNLSEVIKKFVRPVDLSPNRKKNDTKK